MRTAIPFIHPWTNRNVMIGHGSIGLEIMDDLPTVQTIFVPVGDREGDLRNRLRLSLEALFQFAVGGQV